jgi:hypothetical protein
VLETSSLQVRLCVLILVYDVAEDVVGLQPATSCMAAGRRWAADVSWSQFGGTMLVVVPKVGEGPAGRVASWIMT